MAKMWNCLGLCKAMAQVTASIRSDHFLSFSVSVLHALHQDACHA